MSDDYTSDHEYTSDDAQARSDWEKFHSESQQPWWNDGDKVSGLFTTIFFFLVAAVALLGVIKLYQFFL